MMKNIDHPNIAKVENYIENNLMSECYLIMEMLEYPSLKIEKERRGTIDDELMQTITIQILRGV